MQKVINNTHNKILGEELKKIIKPNAKLSILSSFFTIYGFNLIQKELNKIDSVRILISSIDPKNKVDFASVLENRFENKLKNKLNTKAIAKQFASWLEKKANILSLLTEGNTNLIHLDNKNDKDFVIQGSSTISANGLGYTEYSSHELNTLTDEDNATKEMLDWFNGIWNDSNVVKDIKKDMLHSLEKFYTDNPANIVYFFTIYNIFKDYLSDLDEEKIIKSKTGFKDTIVWNKLYKFQKDGVIGAIDKLEKYNGCIIADSVGLGKTFEALAVIKYYELRNDRVLVLAPKRLRDNWTIYTLNDKRNILSTDRFNYDVLNHTDLSRDQGYSGDMNLETINWGNYDLLVIDESHNFRNNNPTLTRETRYERLMKNVIRSGVKTKVLMLSATPVNNRMNDLKNQVAFITEGNDLAFENYGVRNISNTMKIAQSKFNAWLKLDAKDRNIDKLLEMLELEYFRVLDLVTIARSRKHIQKYYKDNDINKFPNRLKPLNIKTDLDVNNEFPPLRVVNKEIRKLNLSLYTPLKYVRPDKEEAYSRKYDLAVKGGASTFRQLDREVSLQNLMRVNILKRMESSINSFSLTVNKILGQVEDLLQHIEKNIDKEFDQIDIEEVDFDDDTYADMLIGSKVKVLMQDMDVVRWKQDLEEDKSRLETLLNSADDVDETRDAKLLKLKELIINKVNSPINGNNKKILIFTAFADTANYLYDSLSEWLHSQFGIYSALVTGSGTNKTTLNEIKTDLNSILTNFSPLSKERNLIDADLVDEIDVIFATDCISEGQNLQDCDFVVNYDIHWNPVRIIQRFGRIDRLGSKNDHIQLVNFWPNMELDEYINLEARVSGRMVLLDISATGEENVIVQDEKNSMNDLEYRKNQLLQLQNQVIDLEDIKGGISITDMTFNDFKMDLMEYLKDNEEQIKATPNGVFSSVNADSNTLDKGVIFCLRKINNTSLGNAHNALEPYYIIYISEEGKVINSFLNSKKSLDVLKVFATAIKVDESAYKKLANESNEFSDMKKYVSLLEKSIASIVGKEEEKGIRSLFTTGGTTFSNDQIRGLDDFEVISYLIIN
jgi:SNF2 family DNA or RNA helicase